MQEFLNHPMHRFKGNQMRYSRLVAPRDILHLSNMPEGITEEDVITLLETVAPVQGFKFFETNKQMAFARMEDVSAAVAVLVKFHGLQPFLGSRHTLQISFSDTKKMDIGRSASS